MASGKRTHVLCIPFPGAGHAVNMFNVAHALATPDISVHLCVMSGREAVKWDKATGQLSNPDVHIDVIADGKWEDWHTEDPRQLVGTIQGEDFAQAISEKIVEIDTKFPDDQITTAVFNVLMVSLPSVFKERGLRGYLLMPGPYYMLRLMTAITPGGTDTPDTDIVFKGIGGIDRDMPAKLGDFIEGFGPMMKMGFSVMQQADGSIYSNTNVGLEGDQYLQSQMEHNGLNHGNEFMIGPLLPPWLEHGLDDPELLKQKQEEASDDECIRFLDRHPVNSVVYIAFGSHASMTVEQGLFLINTLRKFEVPWILLFREPHTAKMRTPLGNDHVDGVITSWAPQIEVMVHPALKCILSHGGFGTMIEGVFAGVPFITSPVTSDQFIDTRVMMHLGICVGSIAENRHTDSMTRASLTPFWPDDGGRTIEALFGRIFATDGGREELENARNAARALRIRMVEAKAKTGKAELQRLRAIVSKENSA